MNWNIGLNFFSTNSTMFEPNQLNSSEFKKSISEQQYHIYLVCKRKKYHLVNCIRKGETSDIHLYYLNDKHDKIYLEYLDQDTFTIDSWSKGVYQVTVNGSNKDTLDDYNLINILDYANGSFESKGENEHLPSDLEVLYIGQAFGRTQPKTIDYRLLNHEKVQRIALDILKEGSSEEVVVIGLAVDSHDIKTSLVLANTNAVPPTIEDLKRVLEKSQRRLSKAQEITVFEASLINYFKPALNIEYKETFPSKDFSSYNELFEINFDYSAIEINTSEIGVRLYSQQAPARKSIHKQHFPLKTVSDKQTLFEYLYELNS